MWVSYSPMDRYHSIYVPRQLICNNQLGDHCVSLSLSVHFGARACMNKIVNDITLPNLHTSEDIARSLYLWQYQVRNRIDTIIVTSRECHGISNYGQLGCLFIKANKTPQLRFFTLEVQANKAESVPIPWRHQIINHLITDQHNRVPCQSYIILHMIKRLSQSYLNEWVRFCWHWVLFTATFMSLHGWLSTMRN